MSADDQAERPVILTNVLNEQIAQLIINALRDEDIEAVTTGGLTAGFRAEAPGEVHIMVHERDLARAKNVLTAFEACENAIETEDE